MPKPNHLQGLLGPIQIITAKFIKGGPVAHGCSIQLNYIYIYISSKKYFIYIFIYKYNNWIVY